MAKFKVNDRVRSNETLYIGRPYYGYVVSVEYVNGENYYTVTFDDGETVSGIREHGLNKAYETMRSAASILKYMKDGRKTKYKTKKSRSTKHISKTKSPVKRRRSKSPVKRRRSKSPVKRRRSLKKK
jgi:hypothetical protein